MSIIDQTFYRQFPEYVYLDISDILMNYSFPNIPELMTEHIPTILNWMTNPDEGLEEVENYLYDMLPEGAIEEGVIPVLNNQLTMLYLEVSARINDLKGYYLEGRHKTPFFPYELAYFRSGKLIYQKMNLLDILYLYPFIVPE